MPKLIASSLSKDDFESMKVGGSMTVKPEGYATASIPVTVEWRNITLNAETPAGPKAILRGLTGHASPGELVAIMGPSGAGKTSLLNSLAQRNASFGGNVLLNGEPWRDAFFSVLAYMPQDEMFLYELTPREHLSYMAQLRLHQKSLPVQAARVEQVIGEMKLGGVADLLIGDPNSEGGLSRNERKRLNFATETLMEPSLLYVDEPTTGLDSVMATNVVQQLKAMASGASAASQNTPKQARQLRTVLCTIHQPSSEIYKLFDKLYFVVDGRAAYFGPTADVPAYFTKLGYPMPARTNPSDFVMELVVDPANRAAASARRLTICDHFSTCEKVEPPNAKSRAALVAVGGVAAAPLSQQFQVLLAREVTMRRRMPILVQAILMRNVVLGLLLGLVMLRLDMTQTYVYTITGSVFFGVASMVMPTAIGHISTIPLQLPCVIREIRSNGFSALPFFAVKFVADVPVDVLGVFVFASLLNFMTGMANDSGTVFLKIALIFFSATLIGNAIGQWASILAPASTPFVGLIVLLVVIIPQFLFCGVLILLDVIPIWWRWMSDLSVFRYFLELTLAAMWASYGDIPCDYLEVKGEPVEICPFPNGQAVLDFYSMGRSPVVCILAIFAWWLFFKVLGYRVLLKKCTPPSSAFGGGSGGPPPDDATAETMPSSEEPNALLNNGSHGNGNTTRGDLEASGNHGRNASVSPLSVSWRDFGFTVEVADANGKGPKTAKTILQGLSGSAEAGELVAVMGGSGSGKSSFLRCLGQRQSEGAVQGRVTFNGSAFSASAHGRGIAFMGQEDDFIAEVTVHEHLLFHASLRMAPGVAPAQRATRVEEVMSGLGLVKTRDTLIGGIGSGISGGERRRLSYAAELLQNPSLLFLDEPTSGLDSSMAEMVVQTLRAAADRGTTVLCSIHQPSAKVFSFFDKLLLLSAGETAYFGARAEALPFFEQLGFPCPADGDAVEHLMSLVDATPQVNKQLPNAASSQAKSSRDQAVAATRQAMLTSSAPPGTNAPAAPANNTSNSSSKATSPVNNNNWLAQLGALMSREMTVRKRSKILTKAVFGRTFFVSFLLSTLYWQVAKDQQGVFSITGALSFIVLNHVFTYVIGQAVNMPAVVPTLKREHHANMYSVESWYLSKTLADLPFDFATTCALATVCYWTIGFTDSGENYAYFLLMLTLVALLATGFGHLVGVVASVLNKPELAVPLAMLVLFPMFLFAGLLVNFNNCPPYLLWLQYISVFYYSFCLVSVNQWKDYGAIDCSAEDLARTGIGRCAFMNGDDVLAYFGINPDDETRNIIIVLCMIVFCRVACIFLLSMKLSKRS